MAKKYHPNLIQIKESYSPSEIAKLFKLDKKTIFRWIKKGLKPIQTNTNPLLIMGVELKNFIKRKQQKRKVKLGDDELFCMKCKKAVNGKNGTVKVVKTGRTIGKNMTEQLNKIGICQFCGSKLNRFLKVCQEDL
jgi:predicted DNA-binding protein YlxM (UPF0122 family)